MQTRGRKATIAVLTVISAALLLLPVAFGADASKPVDGKATFEQKCLKCHKIDKFKKNRTDRKGWELTLRRMERNSCILTDEEANAVATYLSKEFGE